MNEQRENIIASSFQQFKQFGFKSVTMDDIARIAGVSKKTLYALFKDKDELVFEVVKLMVDNNQCQIETAMHKKLNAIEQLINILSIMEKMIQGMNLVCFMDLQRYYPHAYKYLEQHKQECMLRDITQNLQQGIEEGLYRPDVNIDIISLFRMESAMLIFQTGFYHHNKYDIVKVNNELFAHYMYGIASVKGHKLIEKYLNPNSKK